VISQNKKSEILLDRKKRQPGVGKYQSENQFDRKQTRVSLNFTSLGKPPKSYVKSTGITKEQVYSIYEFDSQISVEGKLKAHRDGKLHRAFSIFLFKGKNELLLQKRAKTRHLQVGCGVIPAVVIRDPILG